MGQSMTDPYLVLGIPEDAGDDVVKERYLALVRAFPPDRDPERFQACRAAYEAVRDPRKRLETRLLSISDAAVTRLRQAVLGASQPVRGRATRATLTALLREGLDHAVTATAGRDAGQDSH